MPLAIRPSSTAQAFKLLITFFCHTCPQRQFLALCHSRGYITGVILAKSNSYGKCHQNVQQMVLLLRFVSIARLCEDDHINANRAHCRTKWKRQCWQIRGKWHWKNTLKSSYSLGFLNELSYNRRNGRIDIDRSLKRCCMHVWTWNFQRAGQDHRWHEKILMRDLRQQTKRNHNN